MLRPGLSDNLKLNVSGPFFQSMRLSFSRYTRLLEVTFDGTHLLETECQNSLPAQFDQLLIAQIERNVLCRLRLRQMHFGKSQEARRVRTLQTMHDEAFGER